MVKAMDGSTRITCYVTGVWVSRITFRFLSVLFIWDIAHGCFWEVHWGIILTEIIFVSTRSFAWVSG